MRLVRCLLLSITILLTHCDKEITRTVHISLFSLVASDKTLRGCAWESTGEVNIVKCAALFSRATADVTTDEEMPDKVDKALCDHNLSDRLTTNEHKLNQMKK